MKNITPKELKKEKDEKEFKEYYYSLYPSVALEKKKRFYSFARFFWFESKKTNLTSEISDFEKGVLFLIAVFYFKYKNSNIAKALLLETGILEVDLNYLSEFEKEQFIEINKKENIPVLLNN